LTRIAQKPVSSIFGVTGANSGVLRVNDLRDYSRKASRKRCCLQYSLTVPGSALPANMIKHLLLFSAMSCLLLLTPVTRAEEQIQAPVFEEGNYWKFKVIATAPRNFSLANELWNGVYVIRYLQGRIAVRKLIDENPVVPETSPAMFLGFRPGSRERLLDFPLAVGKRWRYSYPWFKVTRIINLEVIGQENIVTEAGVFHAVKIGGTWQYSMTNPLWGTGTFNTDGVYFYGPEAKSIVKYDAENVDGSGLHIELLKFEPAKFSWN